MDSHKDTTSDESASALDTSHLAASTKKPKKSGTKKLIIGLVVLIVVVAAAIGGGLYYKKTLDDKKAADASAAAKAKAAEAQTPEAKMTATLTDSVKKQLAALEQDDGKASIESSTAAAQKVGRDLDESSLKN